MCVRACVRACVRVCVCVLLLSSSVFFLLAGTKETKERTENALTNDARNEIVST